MSEDYSIPDQTKDRYVRQMCLKQIGKRGQERLLSSSVLLVGCGALGTKLADTLVRAGIGRLLIVDRDILELNNLQRQVLFDEEDVASGLPKAEAVVRKLRRINSTIEVEGRIVDVTARNIEALIGDASLVLDGTDNLETRYLINDACVKLGRPWIYGGVIGTTGMSMNVLPGDGPCLRCVFPMPPPIGSLPTCETQGILGPMPSIISAIQATEAIKILIGAEPSKSLLSIDVWRRRFEQIEVQRDFECPACGRHQFDFLAAQETAWVSSLCGRNAIQITPARETFLSMEQLAERLASVVGVSFNGLLLRCKVEDHELILFPDGRAIVKGTTNEAVARTLYSKYVGG